MNFSMKPHPLIAHWIPGFSVLTLSLLWHWEWSTTKLLDAIKESNAWFYLCVVVAAFVVGEFLDALRDIFEYFLGHMWKIKWEFFFSGDKVCLENLMSNYFTIVERSRIMAIIEEFKLSMTGVLLEENLKKMGRILSVDPIVLVNATNEPDFPKTARKIAKEIARGFRKQLPNK